MTTTVSALSTTNPRSKTIEKAPSAAPTPPARAADGFAPTPTPWVKNVAVTRVTNTSFDGIRAALLDAMLTDHPQVELNGLSATNVEPNGQVRSGGTASLVAMLVEDITKNGAGAFRVTTFTYATDPGGKISKTVTTQEMGGGAWLRTPTYTRAEMERMSFKEFATIMADNGRQYDVLKSVTLTTTDSENDSLRFVASYDRKRWLGNKPEIANVDTQTKEVYFRKS